MIRLTNVTKYYGKEKVVEKLSLNIPPGAIFGFLGPNGAGKTTAIKMIVGLSSISEGSVKVGDKSMANPKNRSIIGFMPEDPYFYDHLTAPEFLQFMSDLGSKTSVQAFKHISKLLQTVGLENAANQPIQNFSKGMKQRLGLAQALVNDPEYLFLDEPLDGLDPIGRREFKKIILGLKKLGKTIFFNTHVLSDVEEICDQIGIINQGKLIYSGPIKKFRGNRSLEDAFVEKINNC